MPRKLGGVLSLWTVGGFVVMDPEKHAATCFPTRVIEASGPRKAAILYAKRPDVAPFFRAWLGSERKGLGLWGMLMATVRPVTA